jgi:uncharacterized delta-60 repeat protein
MCRRKRWVAWKGVVRTHGSALSSLDGGWRLASPHRLRAVGIGLALCLLLGNGTSVVTQAGYLPTPHFIPPLGLEMPAAVPFAWGGGCQFASALYDSTGFRTIYTMDLPTAESECINDMVIDWLGRTVVAGWAIVDGSYQFVVGRFEAGVRDSSFGDDGITVTDFTLGSGEFGYAVAIDGKRNIVVGGGMYHKDEQKGAQLRFALARYRMGGKLDTWGGFGGGDGKQITNILDSVHECITDIAIDSQDRIIAAGWAYVEGHYQIALTRYRFDGELDPSFGNEGVVLTNLQTSDEGAVAVGLSSGRIIVAAQAGEVDGARGIVLASYDEADGDYLGAGFMSASSANQSLRVSDMAIHDGSAVVAGGFDDLSQGTTCFFVGKSDISGNWDPFFGSSGIAIIDFHASTREEALAVAVHKTSGNIVAAGWAEVETDTGPQDRLAVAKLTINGAPITSFSDDGRLLTNMSETIDERIHAVCIYTYELEAEECILAGGVAGDLEP